MEHLLGIAEKQIKALPHQLRGMETKPVVASNTLLMLHDDFAFYEGCSKNTRTDAAISTLVEQ